MPEMTIQQIHEKKRDLEERLLSLLNEFQSQTLTEITRIDFNNTLYRDVGRPKTAIMMQIDIELRIP